MKYLTDQITWKGKRHFVILSDLQGQVMVKTVKTEESYSGSWPDYVHMQDLGSI